MYYCPLHNWSSYYEQCPACYKHSTSAATNFTIETNHCQSCEDLKSSLKEKESRISGLIFACEQWEKKCDAKEKECEGKDERIDSLHDENYKLFKDNEELKAENERLKEQLDQIFSWHKP